MLVPPNNPDAMAEAVLSIRTVDLSSRRLLLRRAVEEKYSWERNVETLVEIYEELI